MRSTQRRQRPSTICWEWFARGVARKRRVDCEVRIGYECSVRPDAGDPRLVDRLRREQKKDVGVPQPVFAEIAYGIERLPRSKRRDALRHRFDIVRAELQRAEWSDGVTEAFGTIKAALERRGRRIEDFDAAIAAHAFALDAVLVTANVDDMVRVAGLIVEDWTARG